MKKIRWRKAKRIDGQTARVDGVRIEQFYVDLADVTLLHAGGLDMQLPAGATREQIDAAAYAIADLAHTLESLK